MARGTPIAPACGAWKRRAPDRPSASSWRSTSRRPRARDRRGDPRRPRTTAPSWSCSASSSREPAPAGRPLRRVDQERDRLTAGVRAIVAGPRGRRPRHLPDLGGRPGGVDPRGVASEDARRHRARLAPSDGPPPADPRERLVGGSQARRRARCRRPGVTASWDTCHPAPATPGPVGPRKGPRAFYRCPADCTTVMTSRAGQQKQRVGS